MPVPVPVHYQAVVMITRHDYMFNLRPLGIRVPGSARVRTRIQDTVTGCRSAAVTVASWYIF